MNKYQFEDHGEQGRERHGSKTFYHLLDEMNELHDRKSHDYATNDNPYGNYLFAGEIARMFAHSPLDMGFSTRLAEKLYRLAVLEGGNKQPRNESISDTERDIAVITALWMAARRDSRPKQVYKAVEMEPRDENEEACSIILAQFPRLNVYGLKGITDYFRRALSDMEAQNAKGIAPSR